MNPTRLGRKQPTITELAAKPLSEKHQRIAEEVCERLSAGESLAEIARAEGMPTEGMLRKIVAHPSISTIYARARDVWSDHEADAIVDYAMQPLQAGEDANLRRTRIDTRKWRLSKQSPRKYGDRLEVTGLGDALAGVVINMVLTPRQTTNTVLLDGGEAAKALPEAIDAEVVSDSE